MIPKIIHYCWFGNNKKSETVRKCIFSWKKHLPNYQFMEWTEKNYPLIEKFTIDAYENKSWAFLVDYVRFDVLKKYGGIYLDTDMLLIKSLDTFLDNECFVGFQDVQLINGAIIGAKPNNAYITNCLNHYKNLIFTSQLPILPEIMTAMLKVEKSKVTVFSTSFFYPLPFLERNKNPSSFIKKNTYSIHLWDASWLDEWQFFANGFKKDGIRKAIIRLKNQPIQPIRYYIKLLKAIVPTRLKAFLKKLIF